MSMSPPNPYAPPQIQSPMAPPMMAGPPPGSAVYAPCPNCQNVYAKRIGYTFWGGLIGPWLLTHVRCCTCNQAYNGKTGNTNTTAIVIWMVAGLAVGLTLGIVGALMQS